MDYFNKSLMNDKKLWAIYEMKGEKEGLVSSQLSESFHNAIRKNKIRFLPMPYIPQNMVNYQHAQIRAIQAKYQGLLSRGIMLPEVMQKNIVKLYEKVNTEYYDIDTQDVHLIAKITSKYQERGTHVINLSVSPPTCSKGCLRLLAIPCPEMLVYVKFTNLFSIAEIIPTKYFLQTSLNVLLESLPPDFPILNIENDEVEE